MWQQIDSSIFGDLIPEKVFIEYDGPRVFSILHDSQWFYVHECVEEVEYLSFFARKTNPDELSILEDNKIQLRDFLKQAPILYLIRIYGGDKPNEAFVVEPDDFSDSYYPDAGCYLYHTQKQDQLPDC